MDIEKLILDAASRGASDIHLTVGLPAVLRIDGALTDLDSGVLTQVELEEATLALAGERELDELRRTGETDFAATIGGSVRLRCNIYHQSRHTAMALRLLPVNIPTAERLGLPSVIIQQAEKPHGLVIVTGPTGSGKSSTLAALIDHINRTERRHIITLENPIEYVHPRVRSVINQREIGVDTESFASGLRAALRQEPDVILVGEMRDLETISTAITAAETGHLVFGTLHTKGAASTVDRMIDVFPAEQQGQVRVQLADVLECVVSQTLLPRNAGGRIAAFEIMTGTSAVRSLIRQNKAYQLSSAMQTGRNQGMQLMDDALAELVRSGEVDMNTAAAKSDDVDAFRVQFF